MKKLKFTKLVGTGNDFILIDFRKSKDLTSKNYQRLAKILCGNKVGIGSDGLLVLQSSSKANFRMRIFNKDGSEAEMCGNGLRCAVLFVARSKIGKTVKIETKAGIYKAKVTSKNKVKIRMVKPKLLKLDIPLKVKGRNVKINYVDTGVPHVVIFVQGLNNIDVESIGRKIRYHKKFKPRGTNVDFVEVSDSKNINLRTYERGVEGETSACGTGAVASAIITSLKFKQSKAKIKVQVKDGTLYVYFKNIDGKIKDVYLEGEAREVYKGEVNYV